MLERIWSQLTSGSRLAVVGAIFALFGFFSTWADKVSNGSLSIEVGGLSLAASNPILYFVLLVGLAVLGLLYFAFREGQLTVLDTYGLIGLGLVGLYLLYLGLSAQIQPDEGIYLVYRPAIWSVILGHLAILIGGVLNSRMLG